MVDENSANSPTSNTPGIPPKDVEATPPITKVGGNTSVPMVDVISSDANKLADSHNEPHPHYKWHAEVLVDGHDVYHGMVKDISMKELNLILDHNLQNSKLVKLHIHIPPVDISNPPHVLEVSGEITSTVYDSLEESFRCRIRLLGFSLESDHAYLQSRLADQ
jgi:hypothetical protein